jgi:DnaD/phage-associated family protein
LYSKIDSRFWNDEKVCSLSQTARYLLLYLLTTPHRNIIGCYRLNTHTARADTELVQRSFTVAWQQLLDNNIIKYDKATKIVLVKNFLKYNPIENPNQAKSAVEKLYELPKSLIYLDILASLKAADKAYLTPIIECITRLIPETLSGTVTGTVGETVNETLSGTVGETLSATSKQYTVSSNSKQYTVDGKGGGIGKLDRETVSEKTAAAVSAYEKNIGQIKPITFEKLRDWLNDVDLSLVEYAIEQAVNCNKRNWSYIHAIINSHFKGGRKTRAEAENYHNNRQSVSRDKPDTLGVLADIIAGEGGAPP